MKRIFISHASADSSLAKRLCDDLRNTGHEVSVDLYALKLGDDLIKFMNDSLSQAHVILILHSKATEQAKWQLQELSAAIWQETAQEGAKVIVLKVDNTNLPPLLGPKFYLSLADEDYSTTLSKLCKDLLPSVTDTALLSQALSEGSPNPFRRVRAEYFDEDMPKLLADAFSPPGAAKFGALEEMKPCFLEGSRGTGKTMLLLSLRARILASRTNAAKTPAQLFGFYLRLERGAFCNAGIKVQSSDDLAHLDRDMLNQLAETFAQEFYLAVIESLISELSFCLGCKIYSLSRAEEAVFAGGIFKVMYGLEKEPSSSFEMLLDHCADIHRQLAEYVRRQFIYKQSVVSPIAALDMVTIRRIVALVKKTLPTLAASQFTLLLDEYENLFPYQQVVVNTVVKLAPPSFSVKIARKVGTHQSSETTIGQDLQEIHDYNQIPLIYSVEEESEFGRYVELLNSIVRNLFSSQDLDYSGLASMLPIDDSSEVDPVMLQSEILALNRMDEEEFSKLSPAKQGEKITYYKEAAIYRLVYGRRGVRAEKRFSGVKNIAFISSGVIRWFQEILGMAYHLEYGSRPIIDRIVISPSNQSKAVHIVSNHNLASLGRNVKGRGEQLKYFLLDLGDCLRQKLLKHSSEPEAARIAIMNPELLEMERFGDLAELLEVAEREGVFQVLSGRSGMRPKHGEPQPVEFNISRIFAPALQFSPRLRWRTVLACADLRGLIEPETRRATKSKIMRRVVTGRKESEQSELSYVGD